MATTTTTVVEAQQSTAREQKEKLTAEGHDTLSSNLNAARSLLQRDADTTKENINGIKKKLILQRYCKYRRKRSWEAVLQSCDKGTMMSFLKYICEQYRVKKTQSLRQYWRQFKMIYDRVNGFKVSSNEAREAIKYILVLEGDFELDPEPKDKPVLGSDDVLLLLTHL